MTREHRPIGFIGLGAMGRHMTANLLRAGHPLVVWARRPEAAESLRAAGAAVATSPRALAERCDTVLTIVTDAAAVDEVVLGEQGVIHGARPGSLVIDMGTISPVDARRVAAALEARGIDHLDAPVSGGPVGAERATLAMMVGGPAPALERARPLLACLAKTIVHVGGHGAGLVAKAANQMIMCVTLQAIAEALLYAKRAGVDAGRVRDALLGGFAGGPILEVFGKRMVEREFTPGVEARLHHKDIGIAVRLARELGLALPASALAEQSFNAIMGNGHGQSDSAVLIEILERMSLGAARP
ncbi:6-phosphogluconate dehydrogenase [Sulfurifustis variabilis]|uniref:6-phosphogluconate dehydrogenase n=1 Tax=Sulfurifustis variabilis TaxID=1675686 RepID=A0A1B4V4Q9_9GAMM|nr:NAD(P)-dependent oxidoreductase [Sulfurifustis variabilis]BAU48395.1 6-phosphogluconate dehydrogenase [Sulfurifustis variabilis]